MKKSLQIWFTAILALFLFPIIIQFLPSETPTQAPKLIKDNAYIVYAANIMEEEGSAAEEDAAEEPAAPSGSANVLLYFTHSEEAYEPVTKAAGGKATASHQTENIMKMGEKLKSQLLVNGINATTLDVHNGLEMKKKGIHYSKAYQAIRPYVKEAISGQPYDLVIDMHRDSLGHDRTTISHEGKDYAKVAFVIGTEHPAYAQNLEMAKRIRNSMETIVPGITREIIKKGGPGVDGKYNQDLDPAVILVELGGIGNTEDELNRTIAIIAEAINGVLNE